MDGREGERRAGGAHPRHLDQHCVQHALPHKPASGVRHQAHPLVVVLRRVLEELAELGAELVQQGWTEKQGGQHQAQLQRRLQAAHLHPALEQQLEHLERETTEA